MANTKATTTTSDQGTPGAKMPATTTSTAASMRPVATTASSSSASSSSSSSSSALPLPRPVSTTSTVNSTKLNTNQLLELERNLYQENIEKNEKQQLQLLDGTLEEFAARCLPFQQDQDHEKEKALVHLQFRRQNNLDLMQFETQQAEDVFEQNKQRFKRRLVQKYQQRLAILQGLLHQMELPRDTNQSYSSAGESGSCPSHESTPERRQQQQQQQRIQQQQQQQPQPPPPPPPRVCVEGTLNLKRLTQIMTESMQECRQVFDLRHLDASIPSVTSICRQIEQETKRFRRRTQKITKEYAKSSKNMHLQVIFDPDDQQVQVQPTNKAAAKLRGTKTRVQPQQHHQQQQHQEEELDQNESKPLVLRVGDQVEVTSFLSEATFVGEVESIWSDRQEIWIRLVCGTPLIVKQAHLITRKCLIQPTTLCQPAAVEAPIVEEDLLVIEPPATNKRQKRKHTNSSINSDRVESMSS